MLSSDQYRNPSSVSLTQEAQKQLIRPLLSERFPIQWDWQYRHLLSSYYISEESNKIAIIMNVMQYLWQGSPGVDLLTFFMGFERFLRAIGKRDHFIHQFEVFLLGWFLLDFMVSKGHNLKTLYSLDPKVFLKIWLMTAMGHDLGFPLQESPKIFEALRDLYKHKSVSLRRPSNLFDKVRKKFSGTTLWRHRPRLVKELLAGHGDKIAEEIILGIAQTTGLSQKMAKKLWLEMERSPKNHGLLSALLFGRAILFPKGELTNEVDIHYLRSLLAAIALHHLKEENPDVIKGIEFSRNPFAYLLYITDNLQEWSRDLGGWTDEPNTILSECEGDDSGIILTFLISHDNWNSAVVERTKSEIEKAHLRLSWLTGVGTGLTLTALYTSANQDIHGKKIAIMI